MDGWATARGVEVGCTVPSPNTADVVSYLEAFYAGIKVELLPSDTFTFSSWDDPATMNRKPKRTPDPPSFVALCTPSTSIRIRVRPASPTSPYAYQLNLDDLLDGAIESLPADAYALLLPVEHDLYESDDDEFCCGRAYGGSRVAVVSSARYQPGLDERQGVERGHGWPASHCASYVKGLCSDADGPSMKKTCQSDHSTLTRATDDDADTPLQAAFTASDPPLSLPNLFLSRLARTASHELGHCLGIDHCVFYACIMQGSASLAEDARQPPYLGPVDVAKLCEATGVGERERLVKLREVGEKWEWGALEARVKGRITELGTQV